MATNTLKIDFTQIPSREPAAAGKHNAVVSKVEVRTSADPTKNPYISWTYEITDGADAGKTVVDITSLAPQALWRLNDVVFAILGEELDGIDLSYDDDGTVLTPRFVGKPVEIDVYHEEYEGRNRARIYSLAAPKTKLVKGPNAAKVLK